MKIVGKLVETGVNVALDIQDRKIIKLTLSREESQIWIAPPLVDIQINGFGGHDLNAETVSVDDVCQMVEAARLTGTGYLCPTVVTGSAERMSRSIEAIQQATRVPNIGQSILGIHVEGPYISSEDGPRGAHPKPHVRPPDWEEFQRWQELAEGQINICTLAPEIDGAIPFIEKLVKNGVIAAIGHTNAVTTDIKDAVTAGARLSTHLGNGAHAQIHRHPNYIWDQLASDDLYASLIVDGHHLPPNVVKSMLRAKRPQKSILISDAVHLAGMKPGRYQFTSREVELTKDRCVKLYGTDYLAGSAIGLINGVENTVRFGQISLPQAIALATRQPAGLLGVADQIGQIRQGDCANLLTFHWDEQNQAISDPHLYLNESI